MTSAAVATGALRLAGYIKISADNIWKYRIYRMYLDRQAWINDVGLDKTPQKQRPVRVYTVCRSSSNF